LSQVLNFMWLNLELPARPDPAEGAVREPMPAHYIKNVRAAALRHPSADIVLWVDSKRPTEKQMAYLKETIEGGSSNAALKDLRSIPAYDSEKLFNENAADARWRDMDQTSEIWRQVDAAKVLISLQGSYDQTFFADLDRAHLDIDRTAVQERLQKNGLFIGSPSGRKDNVSIENQVWGFEKRRRRFFESYYQQALKDAYDGENAWNSLIWKVRLELMSREAIPLQEICLPLRGDGTEAEHSTKKVFNAKAEDRRGSLLGKAVRLGLHIVTSRLLFKQ
jgi:hypothetical protein